MNEESVRSTSQQCWEEFMICQKVRLYQLLSETDRVQIENAAFRVNVLQSYLLNLFEILDKACESDMTAESISMPVWKLNNSELSNSELNNSEADSSESNNPESNNWEADSSKSNNPESNNWEMNSSESNNPELNNWESNSSKLNIKQNMSCHILNLVKTKMTCKKLKRNNHRSTYLLWRWNIHLFSPEASDNACSLYTDVSLTANLNSNNEATWPLKKQIMLDDYWMREVVCREIQSEKWESCWLRNFNKKGVTCMQCQLTDCTLKKLKKFRGGVKAIYYCVILNKYQLIENEGMQAGWSYLINKLKNLTMKSLTLWGEVTADLKDWLRTVDELMRQYEVEHSNVQSDEENDRDQNKMKEAMSEKEGNKKKKDENAVNDWNQHHLWWAGQTESESVRSDEGDEDSIDDEYRTKWRRANFSSDDLELLSLPAWKKVNTDAKEKYDAVIQLAYELDQTLFEQLTFKKKLFTELSEILTSLKLIKQLKVQWNMMKAKWDELWKTINEDKFSSLKVIFCHSSKGSDEMSWLYETILLSEDTQF